jgi:hypothetical protein
MRRDRNPRRAYNPDGTEIRPATVASSLAAGQTRITLYCKNRACGHSGEVQLAGLPPELAIPDIALSAVCSACGCRDIMTMIHIGDLYRKLDAERDARNGRNSPVDNGDGRQ